MERRQPAAVLSLLLAAIWLAAVVSVGLQFYQWLVLQPGESTAWVYSAIGGRPSANLGQANSVGTIIVIALLGTYWLWYRAAIGAALALAVATFLLMGLALTQSRTALLNALFIAASIYLWHRHRAGPRMTLSLLGLVVVLCVAFVGYSAIGRLAEQLPSLNLAAERASAGARPLAWQVFADGVLQRPLGGYGWGQSFLAQVEVSLNHPPIHRVFLSAHNLLIDLALWSGLPIALLVLAVVAWWLRECIRRIEDEASMLLLLLIVVLLVHSLFEYPLAYAYFLLPAGLAAGALNQRMDFKLAGTHPPGSAPDY